MKQTILFFVTLFTIGLSGCAATKTAAPTPGGAQRFATPSAAADALKEALTIGGQDKLLSIFGANSKGLLSSGDEVADKNALQQFTKALQSKHSVEAEADDRYVLLVGDKEWPFPIPIVSDGKQWSFDAAAGKEEILDRRIGENELKTIRLLRSYVQAQKEYFQKDRDGDKVREYAQKAFSSPGKRDGLYWPSTSETDQSPFGPLAAEAAQEGYRRKGEEPIPYHGYYFKILTSQGAAAEGGKKNYLDKRGNMTKGFALLAYPSRWNASGIMTFLVSADGVVYQKDRGVQTLAEAESTTEFNPDRSWEPVADPAEDAVESD